MALSVKIWILKSRADDPCDMVKLYSRCASEEMERREIFWMLIEKFLENWSSYIKGSEV